MTTAEKLGWPMRQWRKVPFWLHILMTATVLFGLVLTSADIWATTVDWLSWFIATIAMVCMFLDVAGDTLDAFMRRLKRRAFGADSVESFGTKTEHHNVNCSEIEIAEDGRSVQMVIDGVCRVRVVNSESIVLRDRRQLL